MQYITFCELKWVSECKICIQCYVYKVHTVSENVYIIASLVGCRVLNPVCRFLGTLQINQNSLSRKMEITTNGVLWYFDLLMQNKRSQCTRARTTVNSNRKTKTLPPEYIEGKHMNRKPHEVALLLYDENSTRKIQYRKVSFSCYQSSPGMFSILISQRKCFMPETGLLSRSC